MTSFVAGMLIGIFLYMIFLAWMDRQRTIKPPDDPSPEAMARAEVLLHGIQRRREVDELKDDMQRRLTKRPPPLP